MARGVEAAGRWHGTTFFAPAISRLAPHIGQQWRYVMVADHVAFRPLTPRFVCSPHKRVCLNHRPGAGLAGTTTTGPHGYPDHRSASSIPFFEVLFSTQTVLENVPENWECMCNATARRTFPI